MIDLHNHTPYCHHAIGDPAEYVERARAMGMREYGFAEHSPWMHQYAGEQIAPSNDEFDEYLDVIEALRDRENGRGEMNLRIGIEVDFIPEKTSLATDFLNAYPFDFCIGSIHNIGDWIFDHPDHLDRWNSVNVREVYETYFALMRQMIEWDEIDIIAHLDLPKKFGHRPEEGYIDLVRDLIPAVKKSGLVVEVNTAGLDKPVGEFYPSDEIVQLLVEENIPLTISSDAHKPEQVGAHHKRAIKLLKKLGVQELYTFDKRHRLALPL